MQALILAGGKGTRLRPLTVYTPKPVVPVMNRPFLLYQLDILRAADVTDVTLSLSYQPDKIEHVLGNGSEFGISLRYLTEPSPLGTAGAYRFAADALGETTIVLNGDILTDLDLTKVIEFHKEKKAEATIVVVPVEDVSRYGVVEIGGDGSVSRFIEKPEGDALSSVTANTINAGIYILEPAILEMIVQGTPQSFEYDLFPKILEQNMPFFAYEMSGSYWRDIGTPENYLRAHHDFLDGKIAATSGDEPAVFEAATRSEIDKRSIIGEGCTIKPGVRVTNSVIGPGVYLDEKCIVENSVLWAHSRVSTGAEIRSSIVGRSCHIGRNAIVGEGSVLGDKTTLTDYTRV